MFNYVLNDKTPTKSKRKLPAAERYQKFETANLAGGAKTIFHNCWIILEIKFTKMF